MGSPCVGPEVFPGQREPWWTLPGLSGTFCLWATQGAKDLNLTEPAAVATASLPETSAPQSSYRKGAW